MRRRLFTVAWVMSLLMCAAVALSWIISFRLPISFEFTYRRERREIVSRDGYVWVDNAPQLQAASRHLTAGRAHAETLLTKIDELQSRARALYDTFGETKPLDAAAARELRAIQTEKNALLAQLSALGYFPVVLDEPFDTHTLSPVTIIPNIYVMRDYSGQPTFWRQPALPPIVRTRKLPYLHVQTTSLALLTVAASPLLIHRFRRRKRTATRCCVRCGYDLRASTRRCPECGNAIPQTEEARCGA